MMTIMNFIVSNTRLGEGPYTSARRGSRINTGTQPIIVLGRRPFLDISHIQYGYCFSSAQALPPNYSFV
jgi:hypothetical protein